MNSIMKEALARKRMGTSSPDQMPDLESADASDAGGAQEQPEESQDLAQVVDHLKSNPEMLELVKNFIADSAEQGEENSEDGDEPDMNEMDGALTESMTDYDKGQMDKAEPSSLGGKARKAALERIKNKA